MPTKAMSIGWLHIVPMYFGTIGLPSGRIVVTLHMLHLTFITKEGLIDNVTPPICMLSPPGSHFLLLLSKEY